MPQRQPKAAIAKREEKLLRYYAKVWQDVVDLQAAIVADPKQFRKVRKLREAQRAIEAQLDTVDAVAAQWFSKTFPEVWGMGVSASARELKADAGRVFSAINTDAVQKLADDGFGDLLKATRNVRLTQKRMIRSVIEDVTLNKLIAGDTAVVAGKRAAKLIEKAGVSAITYADGSRHGLREYANMAVRTKTAVAYNLGTLEAATSQGVKFWEIFDGICGLAYHDGPTANGMIVDYDTALAYPISHPNCRRAFGARPDLEELPRKDQGTPETQPEAKVLEPTPEARERATAAKKAAEMKRWKTGRTKAVRTADPAERKARREALEREENYLRGDREALAKAEARVAERLEELKQYVPDAKERAKVARSEYELKQRRQHAANMRQTVEDQQKRTDEARARLEAIGDGSLPDFNPDNPLEFYGDKLTIYDESDSTRKHLRELEDHVPQPHHEALRDYYASGSDSSGFYVGDRYITDMDDLGGLKGVQPRGWEPGSTFDEVPGVYDPARRVCACGGDSKGHGSTSLVLHEGGHALDEAVNAKKGLRGRASASSDYREILDDPETAAYIEDQWNPYYRASGNPDGHASESWAEGYAGWAKSSEMSFEGQMKAVRLALSGLDGSFPLTIADKRVYEKLVRYYQSL